MNNPETLIDRYAAAVKAVDKAALLALYSPAARIFDMTMPWQSRGINDWGAKIEEWFSDITGMNAEAIATNVEVHATDEMALLTMYMGYYDENEQGEREGMTNRLTWVAVPSGDDWHIVHEHTSAPLTTDDMQVVWEPEDEQVEQIDPM